MNLHVKISIFFKCALTSEFLSIFGSTDIFLEASEQSQKAWLVWLGELYPLERLNNMYYQDS